jgi:hypothetical protein
MENHDTNHEANLSQVSTMVVNSLHNTTPKPATAYGQTHTPC